MLLNTCNAEKKIYIFNIRYLTMNRILRHKKNFFILIKIRDFSFGDN